MAYICHDCEKSFPLKKMDKTRDSDDLLNAYSMQHHYVYRCEKCNEALVKKVMIKYKYTLIAATREVYPKGCFK